MFSLSWVIGTLTVAGGIAMFRYVAALWSQLPASNEDMIIEMRESPPLLRPAGATDAAYPSACANARVQTVAS